MALRGDGMGLHRHELETAVTEMVEIDDIEWSFGGKLQRSLYISWTLHS